MNLHRVLAGAGVAALITLAPSLDVDAHSDDGVIEIVTAQPARPLSVTYDINLTYTNDNDPADGATVTLAADGPDNTTIGPVSLEPSGQPGHYTATITYPTAGDWAIRISALSPLAALTRTDNIAAATPATPTSSPPAPGVSAPTAPPATGRPSGTASAASADPASVPPMTAVPADDDGPGSAMPWAIAGIALVAVAAIVVARRRTSRASHDAGHD